MSTEKRMFEFHPASVAVLLGAVEAAIREQDNQMRMFKKYNAHPLLIKGCEVSKKTLGYCKMAIAGNLQGVGDMTTDEMVEEAMREAADVTEFMETEECKQALDDLHAKLTGKRDGDSSQLDPNDLPEGIAVFGAPKTKQ